MVILALLIGLLASVLFVGPMIYIGLPALAGQIVSFPRAVGVALAALAVGSLVNVLLGWLPVLGSILSPLSWAVVIHNLTKANTNQSLLLGFLGWALTTVAYLIV